MNTIVAFRGHYLLSIFRFALLAAASSSCAAQYTHTLDLTDVVPTTSHSGGGRLEPSRCDEDGNIYVRIIPGGRPYKSPVTRFSSDGAKSVVFDLSGVTGKGSWVVPDFYPGDRGDVYELAQDSDGVFYLVRFSNDGEFQSATEITTPSPASLSHVVALTGGRFLVSGILEGQITPGRKAVPQRPFTAIFSADGKLIKELRLKDDPAATEARSQSGANDAMRSGISLGSVIVDEQGNIYVTRHSLPLKIYVLSSLGDFRRVITVRSPWEKAEIGRISVSGGRVVVEFYQPTPGDAPNPTIFRVVDAQSGEYSGDYRQVPDFIGSFVCYRSGTFIFFGSAKGVETIFHASPR